MRQASCLGAMGGARGKRGPKMGVNRLDVEGWAAREEREERKRFVFMLQCRCAPPRAAAARQLPRAYCAPLAAAAASPPDADAGASPPAGVSTPSRWLTAPSGPYSGEICRWLVNAEPSFLRRCG